MEISMHPQTFSLLFFLIFSTLASSKACHPVDKEALLDFKHKITDDPSKLLHSWRVSSDCCTSWEGVACDASGRVVNVSRPGLASDNDFIEDTYMSGTLSPYLGNLSSLQVLDLSNLKDLKGPIPEELGKLSKLTHLFLDTNKLTGSIPFTLRYLSQLEKMYLSDNFISGIVPPSVMKSWTHVSELGLSGNALSGPIPPTIGKVVMITKLDLHGNNFTGRIPTGFGNLKNLRYLDLSENQITGSIPQSIGGLAALELLYLNQNQLTGRIPSSISEILKIAKACRNSTSKVVTM
jgi:Leucine-rich repeat (LRR) protein